MIKSCTCKHKQQDELHGKHNRVYNTCSMSGPCKGYARCTVCGNLKLIGRRL